MRFIGLFLLIILSLPGFSQGSNIPVGTWRAHLTCNSPTTLAVSASMVYAGSNQSLMSYSLKEKTASILSKYEGFTDVSVSKIAYYPEMDVVMIGYESGNIDLVYKDKILNISDIKRKSITGSKRINDVCFYKKFAYLATDFGMVTIDLVKIEVKDAAMNIGENGKQIKLTSITVNEDSVYAVSSSGIMSASVHSNLLNFNNWKTYSRADSIPVRNLAGIDSFKGKVYAAVTSYRFGENLINQDSAGLYCLSNGKWKKVFSFKMPVFNVNSTDPYLLIPGESRVIRYTDTYKDTLAIPGHGYEAAYDMEGNMWIADARQGLLSNKNGSINLYQPNSPFSGVCFRLAYGNKTIYNLHGGFNYSSTSNFFNPEGIDLFDEDKGWRNYSGIRGNFPSSIDISDAVFNPVDNKLYIASYGSGVIVMQNEQVVEHYTEDNSPLINLFPGTPYVRTASVAVDESGNTWIVNAIDAAGKPILHRKSPEGTWTSYNIPVSTSNYTPFELLIDRNNNKWIRTRAGGSSSLILFNENYNGVAKTRFIEASPGRGGLPSARVLSMAVDEKGEIWVGTDKGVAILKDASQAFETDFIIPYYDGFPILMEKEVTAIEVDASDKKWIGTRLGLWHFNADASEVLAFYDENNSPLPSSEIKDLEVNDNTGELFISTGAGLVAFRGAATAAEVSEFGTVKVFPNPVRANFDGMIGISGLARGATVKITDMYGNLIHETEADGGMAVWNGKNYNGERANTGVYLIFSVSADGVEGYVAKVAIVE